MVLANSEFTQNVRVSNGCLVTVGVRDGCVAVAVGVEVTVGVTDSVIPGVRVSVAGVVSVGDGGMGVGVDVGAAPFTVKKISAAMSTTSAMTPGRANFCRFGGRKDFARSKGVTEGGSPANPNAESRFRKLLMYSSLMKFT